MIRSALRRARWDAPFWGCLLIGIVAAGAIGCLGIAVAQTTPPPSAEIMTTDNCPPPADL